MATPPIIYGVPFSQPVRAVMWLMLYKQAPFQMVPTNPGSKGDNGSRNPNFLAKNPAGTIPTLEEPDTGFTLGEAHAIMAYLCDTNGWDDVYPADLQQRGKVNWYLNFHHRNVRDASVGLVAPKIRKDLNIPEAVQAMARSNVTGALKMLDGMLAEQSHIAGNTLTIADFAAYVEIGQVQPQFTNVFDLSPFDNVQRWLGDMSNVPGHDVVHVALAELGDISVEAPSMEVIKSANMSAFGALKTALEAMG